jgi:DNA polymerase III delta subunit
MSIHYLFLGNDVVLKDEKLAQLKANLFSSSDAEKFDCELLDGYKLTSEALQVALASVPALSIRRLVIIRRADKLSKENLIAIEKFLVDAPENPVLVLEAAQWDMKSAERKSVRARLQIIGALDKEGHSVWNMMDAVCAGNTVDGLVILKELLDRGEREELLLGGMASSWSRDMKGRIPFEKYKKGLLVLQEADHHLKRSRFPSREQALETAIVRLSLLLRV